MRIALADQLQSVSRSGQAYLRRVPHKQVSVVINRATAPHDTLPVYAKELAQPPSRVLETRHDIVNMRRAVVNSTWGGTRGGR